MFCRNFHVQSCIHFEKKLFTHIDFVKISIITCNIQFLEIVCLSVSQSVSQSTFIWQYICFTSEENRKKNIVVHPTITTWQ